MFTQRDLVFIHIKKYKPILLLFLSLCFFSGCTNAPDNIQNLASRPARKIFESHSIGQTFVAKHDGLSRVDVFLATYRRPQLFPIIFTLKSSPQAEENLAQIVAWPLTITDNQFRGFSFPAIPESAGKTFYFEIQSPVTPEYWPITIWYEPADVYKNGEMYVDGEPINADAKFRTYYKYGAALDAPSYYLSQLAANKPTILGTQNFYVIIFASYFLLVVVLFFSFSRVIQNRYGTQVPYADPMPQKWWRKVTIDRITVILVILSLLKGIIYVSVTPPWQVPDEPGHFIYAELMGEKRAIPNVFDISDSKQQDILQSMEAFNFWQIRKLAGHPLPTIAVKKFDDVEPLRSSRPQIGDEPPIYYASLAVFFPLIGEWSLVEKLYFWRIISMLYYVGLVGIAILVGQLLFCEKRWQISLPLTVSLMPMLTFIGTGVNNDMLAALFAAVTLYYSLRLILLGFSRFSFSMMLIGLVGSLLIKKTSLFLLIVLGTVTIGWLVNRLPWKRYAWIILIIGAMLASLLLALASWPSKQVASWGEYPYGFSSQCNDLAYDGEYSFCLQQSSTGDNLWISQSISGEKLTELKEKPLVLSLYVSTKGEALTGEVELYDTVHSKSVPFETNSRWQEVAVPYTVDKQAKLLTVMLKTKEGGKLYFDNIRLYRFDDSKSVNLLHNSSAERSRSMLETLRLNVSRYFSIPADLLQNLTNSENYNFDALIWYSYGLSFLFRTFWGNFGWLTSPVSNGWYLFFTAFTGISLFNVLFYLFRHYDKEKLSRPYIAILVMLLTLLVIVAQSMMPLINGRRTWLPQGRYLFGAIIPFAVLLLWGLHHGIPSRWHNLTLYLLIISLIMFDTFSLFLYIIPSFYNLGGI